MARCNADAIAAGAQWPSQRLSQQQGFDWLFERLSWEKDPQQIAGWNLPLKRGLTEWQFQSTATHTIHASLAVTLGRPP